MRCTWYRRTIVALAVVVAVVGLLATPAAASTPPDADTANASTVSDTQPIWSSTERDVDGRYIIDFDGGWFVCIAPHHPPICTVVYYG